jgi:hypothetical protein
VSKFNNKKCEHEGFKFDSIKEMNRFIFLQQQLTLGKIRDLRLQVKYVLIPKNDKFRSMSYVADFVYKIGSGNVLDTVEDCKGFKTEVYKIKRKLMYSVYGVLINET